MVNSLGAESAGHTPPASPAFSQGHGKADISKLVDEEAPMCISPRKTINKQLQTDENSSGKAKDYNEAAPKVLRELPN